MKQNMTYRSGDYSQREYPPDIDKYIADYDAYRNPQTSTAAAHQAINYTYDTIGRMTDLYDQVNPSKSTHFVYDKRGLLQSKTDMLNPSPLSRQKIYKVKVCSISLHVV
jgi:YD repeat-containing protein